MIGALLLAVCVLRALAGDSHDLLALRKRIVGGTAATVALPSRSPKSAGR